MKSIYESAKEIMEQRYSGDRRLQPLESGGGGGGGGGTAGGPSPFTGWFRGSSTVRPSFDYRSAVFKSRAEIEKQSIQPNAFTATKIDGIGATNVPGSLRVVPTGKPLDMSAKPFVPNVPPGVPPASKSIGMERIKAKELNKDLAPTAPQTNTTPPAKFDMTQGPAVFKINPNRVAQQKAKEARKWLGLL
jgi:hypothetical protein